MLSFLPQPGPSVPAVSGPWAQLSWMRKPIPPLLVSICCSSVTCTWDEFTAHWRDCFPPLSHLTNHTGLAALLCLSQDTCETKVTLTAAWQAQTSCLQSLCDLWCITGAMVISQHYIQNGLWSTLPVHVLVALSSCCCRRLDRCKFPYGSLVWGVCWGRHSQGGLLEYIFTLYILICLVYVRISELLKASRWDLFTLSPHI